MNASMQWLPRNRSILQNWFVFVHSVCVLCGGVCMRFCVCILQVLCFVCASVFCGCVGGVACMHNRSRDVQRMWPYAVAMAVAMQQIKSIHVTCKVVCACVACVCRCRMCVLCCPV